MNINWRSAKENPPLAPLGCGFSEAMLIATEDGYVCTGYYHEYEGKSSWGTDLGMPVKDVVAWCPSKDTHPSLEIEPGRITVVTVDTTDQDKARFLLEQAANKLQDYCSEVNGDMNDSLAMEILAYLDPTGEIYG